MNYLDFLSLVLKKQADPKQSLYTTRRMMVHKLSPPVVTLVNTLTWKVCKTEQDLIRRYREIALHPECDMAIEDIVNEAVVANELKDAIKLRLKLDQVPFGSEIKRKIEDEFQEVLRLMNFNTKGHDIFRRWYVDGMFTIIK